MRSAVTIIESITISSDADSATVQFILIIDLLALNVAI